MIKTIIIAEDEDLIRKYIVRDVETSRPDKFRIVAEAKTGLELLKFYKKHQPDILLVDLQLPELSGWDAIEEIRKTDQEVIIIVLTSTYSKAAVEELYPMVNSYLIKSKETPEQLIEKLDAIALYKSSDFRKYILDIIAPLPTLKKDVTFREFEIISQVEAGLSNQAIADKLCLSVKSIEKTLTSVYKKFSVKNRRELIDKLQKNRISG